jgi:hypothetical protein
MPRRVEPQGTGVEMVMVIAALERKDGEQECSKKEGVEVEQ